MPQVVPCSFSWSQKIQSGLEFRQFDQSLSLKVLWYVMRLTFKRNCSFESKYSGDECLCLPQPNTQKLSQNFDSGMLETTFILLDPTNYLFHPFPKQSLYLSCAISYLLPPLSSFSDRPHIIYYSHYLSCVVSYGMCMCYTHHIHFC